MGFTGVYCECTVLSEIERAWEGICAILRIGTRMHQPPCRAAAVQASYRDSTIVAPIPCRSGVVYFLFLRMTGLPQKDQRLVLRR